MLAEGRSSHITPCRRKRRQMRMPGSLPFKSEPTCRASRRTSMRPLGIDYREYEQVNGAGLMHPSSIFRGRNLAFKSTPAASGSCSAVFGWRGSSSGISSLLRSLRRLAVCEDAKFSVLGDKRMIHTWTLRRPRLCSVHLLSEGRVLL